MDLEFEIEKIKQSEPFIAVTGKVGDENCQKYFICAEQALSTSLRDTFLDLICAYYMYYNNSYPKSIHFFFQEIVFGIKGSQKLPLCVIKLLKNLESTSLLFPRNCFWYQRFTKTSFKLLKNLESTS